MKSNQWRIITCIAVVLLGNMTARAALPPGAVTVTVTGGDDSFFDARLSGVPGGYEVGNNTYLAWCVDLYNATDPTLGGGTHIGVLAAAPTGTPWDKINYLLNHKQGTATDIQYALWHFTDGFNPDPAVNPLSIAMIADTEAHGAGYVPTAGEVKVVVVNWQGADRDVQQILIELPSANIPECADRFTAGGFIYRNRSKVTFGIQGGLQNGRLWGGINFVDHGARLHVQSRSITSYTVLSDNCRRATYAVTINGAAGTATVRICDNGEPGRNDVMEITLSNGYSAGLGTTLGGTGQGGGNVQLHKPRCGENTPKKPKGRST